METFFDLITKVGFLNNHFALWNIPFCVNAGHL